MSGSILTLSNLFTSDLPDNTAGLITPAFIRNGFESGSGVVFLTESTTNHNAALTERGCIIKMNNAAASTFTIASGIFAAGMCIGCLQENTGQVTFTASGTTFKSSTGTVTTRVQNSLVWAYADPDTANLFWLFGDLT